MPRVKFDRKKESARSAINYVPAAGSSTIIPGLLEKPGRLEIVFDELRFAGKVTHVLSKTAEAVNEKEAEKKNEKGFDSFDGVGRFTPLKRVDSDAEARR